MMSMGIMQQTSSVNPVTKEPLENISEGLGRSSTTCSTMEHHGKSSRRSYLKLDLRTRLRIVKMLWQFGKRLMHAQQHGKMRLLGQQRSKGIFVMYLDDDGGSVAVITPLKPSHFFPPVHLLIWSC